MADFMTNLWESVFTPGTTPTLLVATNVTFAVLQVLLATLLIATYSIHFFILSFLSGGLWYAINWFAREVQLAQAHEATSKQQSKRDGEHPAVSSTRERDDLADDEEGDDTEVEMDGHKTAFHPPPFTTAAPQSVASGAESLAGAKSRQRQIALAEDLSRGSDVSTDSEWEKVDG